MGATNVNIKFNRLYHNNLSKRINTKTALLCGACIIIGIYTIKLMLSSDSISDIDNRHIFIYRSFFYPKAKSFGDGTKSAVAILAAIDKEFDVSTLQPICEIRLNDGSITHANAEIKPIHDARTSMCRLWSYRFLCHSLHVSEDVIMGKKFTFTPDFSLRFQNKISVSMPLTRADTIKRTLVICPGRMFTFDMWHLFLLTMEIHRINQVDLVVIYIQSVDARVYELIKEYGFEKWVLIRPSLRMPASAVGLDYDPNAETTWNNQLINFHDCLYEFRESAQFIAFPDWDDLFFASGAMENFGESIRPLGKIFQQLALENPRVASFVMQRTGGYLNKLDETFTKEAAGETLTTKNIVSSMRNALAFSTYDSIGGGKVVCRPLLTDGLEIHVAATFGSCFHEYIIPWNDTFIIHARNHIERKLDHHLTNITKLEDGITAFLTRRNFTSLIEKLPRKEIMLNTFNTCLGVAGVDAWKNIVKLVSESKKSHCYNYAMCNLKMPKLDCVNVQTTWRSVEVIPDELYMSYFMSARFNKEDTCVV